MSAEITVTVSEYEHILSKVEAAEKEAELWKDAYYASIGEFLELKTLYDNLGTHERKVLLRVGERLILGQRQYGRFEPNKDTRDWIQESTQEALDGCVYLSLQLIGMKE